MVRIRHVSGPGRLNHGAFDGVSTHGDEHDLDADTAAYFCENLGYFEYTDEVVLSDGEYTVVDNADDADSDDTDGLDDLTKSDLYDRATEADIEGRSSMDKAELIDALRED